MGEIQKGVGVELVDIYRGGDGEENGFTGGDARVLRAELQIFVGEFPQELRASFLQEGEFSAFESLDFLLVHVYNGDEEPLLGQEQRKRKTDMSRPADHRDREFFIVGTLAPFLPHRQAWLDRTSGLAYEWKAWVNCTFLALLPRQG